MKSSTKNPGRAWFCSLLSCLLLIITALYLSPQAKAAPVETSHWNSNTFGNLNALTDKTAITFKIAYGQMGTIEWYKDGTLAETDANTSSAEYTTSWTAIGMKRVQAKMRSSSGTSSETKWRVEVQELGTAALDEVATDYRKSRINAYLTINVTNGWVNFPTLYLKTKKPDQWLEYVEAGPIS